MATQPTTQTIELNYQNATLSANTAVISVGHGGSFTLARNEFLSINGTFTFATLNISSGAISFYNTASGTSVNGTVSIPVTATQDPTITASNFSGTVTLSWPSSEGPQYQQLSPGDPITLTGFVQDDS
jgi:hypothetical protein